MVKNFILDDYLLCILGMSLMESIGAQSSRSDIDMATEAVQIVAFCNCGEFE
jgi:hypothetical protein